MSSSMSRAQSRGIVHVMVMGTWPMTPSEVNEFSESSHCFFFVRARAVQMHCRLTALRENEFLRTHVDYVHEAIKSVRRQPGAHAQDMTCSVHADPL
eukprot:CAMPEP_0194496364 /NCGR_PEP_ID=MMETSP0253-20130528/13664_1 /TAXON_ID=2966 /ORGANISM="Noctiluca scintillans" /LENGTH=96 /DNA_ID=CAMNT_0039337753 /DNA_START=363 /DNA_END=650 /DNA_ORIENTATION=-